MVDAQQRRIKFGQGPVTFCLLFCLATGSGFSAEDHPLLPANEGSLTRLRVGEVVLESATTGENGAEASVLIFMQAPVERIWANIISCKKARIWVAGLQFCEVLEELGDHALTRQVVDEGWATPRLDFTFEIMRQPYRHMEFRLTQGNLKNMHGSWDFETIPDGILVRHQIAMQPDAPAPRWLMLLHMKNALPKMMRCIRGLSAGSGSEESIHTDLQQCPGQVPER